MPVRRPARASAGAAVALLAALALFPVVGPAFAVYVLALILVTGLLALSLNLVLGYGGLYQFHHAVFYGVGAYTLAVAVTRGGWPAWLGFLAGPLAAALAGLLIGWFCVRLTRLYFGMLQISLGSLLWIVVLRWYPVTGGDNGIHDIPLPAVLQSVVGAYYLILAVVALSAGVLYLIVRSPFGITLQAIRDNAQRCQTVGVDVRAHQIGAIVIAAFFAGTAGVLYVALERSVFPNLLFWVLSLEIFVMCLLGGWFTFAGPMLGAALMVALRTVIGRYTDLWTMFVGIILILLIFFMPEGVAGTALARLRARGAGAGGRG
ncbi:MAG: branched-chain amino acid ABC transporter permease [Armatimonadota bacterium]|nr:branched-chain amino acid ABC transporter permease [Armatimonadota bacterium]MDR7421523.1 branched-chain amino acid ABC transporter permease [Armatimonadota bacterium]MDR7454889.1 branched-chain amino acid ABC transporter permease [Armatimonadota bacterium]MDR7497020.1 branched-chain amino acid ABC transporter permease [Armatimonadota bacterium]MDR7510508.1 branched-chain amino acid ABC transporter permease [Armatimonadota bacterium]